MTINKTVDLFLHECQGLPVTAPGGTGYGGRVAFRSRGLGRVIPDLGGRGCFLPENCDASADRASQGQAVDMGVTGEDRMVRGELLYQTLEVLRVR